MIGLVGHTSRTLIHPLTKYPKSINTLSLLRTDLLNKELVKCPLPNICDKYLRLHLP